MKLPNRGREIIHALYSRNVNLANGTDDQRRALTLMIAQQLTFELGPSWGTKSAGPGRPPSKDSICQLQPDGRLINFDWQWGDSRLPIADPDGEDITGQVFLRVAPVDHLNVSVVQPPTPPPVQPPTPERPIDVILARLDRMEEEFIEVLELIAQKLAQPAPLPPNYVGSVFGAKVVLRPEK